MQACVEISKGWTPFRHPGLPDCFCGAPLPSLPLSLPPPLSPRPITAQPQPHPHPPTHPSHPGGWVGYTSYDTIRYVYKDKLRFGDAPPDDRNLPDISLGLYKEVVVFDQATKLAYAVEWVSTRSSRSPQEAFAEGQRRLAGLVARLQASTVPTLQAGAVTLNLGALPPPHATSNMTKPGFLDMIAKAKEHIKARDLRPLAPTVSPPLSHLQRKPPPSPRRDARPLNLYNLSRPLRPFRPNITQAGDIFQVVLGQRFERRTFADPFEVYRALRVVNPSPYMIYMQARGSVLVASSPEILCRVTSDNTVVNRPLAGTRKRGATQEEDVALEKDLLARSSHCASSVSLPSPSALSPPLLASCCCSCGRALRSCRSAVPVAAVSDPGCLRVRRRAGPASAGGREGARGARHAR